MVPDQSLRPANTARGGEHLNRAPALLHHRLRRRAAGYVADGFSAEQWRTAETATAALRKHFSDARFAETTYGVLLVPDLAKLDTRPPMSPEVRRDQLGQPAPDVIDERLPPGNLGIGPGQDWRLVATVTGPYGISLGSYENVSGGPAEASRSTFTLFVGEKLIDGRAESGTVLKGRVRFRLGKPNRGIGSARIAPAIAIP